MRLLEERLEYEGTNQVIIHVNKVIIMLSIHIAAQKLQIKGMYKISKSMVWSHFSIFSTCDWIFRQLNCKSRAVYKLKLIVDTPLRSWSQITVIRMLTLLLFRSLDYDSLRTCLICFQFYNYKVKSELFVL